MHGVMAFPTQRMNRFERDHAIAGVGIDFVFLQLASLRRDITTGHADQTVFLQKAVPRSSPQGFVSVPERSRYVDGARSNVSRRCGLLFLIAIPIPPAMALKHRQTSGVCTPPVYADVRRDNPCRADPSYIVTTRMEWLQSKRDEPAQAAGKQHAEGKRLNLTSAAPRRLRVHISSHSRVSRSAL